MIKKLICILILTLIAIFFCGCDSQTNGGDGYIVHRLYSSMNFVIFTFVDKETGINYLVYSGTNKGSITPRLNADGTLYVEEN